MLSSMIARRYETKMGRKGFYMPFDKFLSFSKMGRVSAVLMGYFIDLEGGSRNF